MASNSYNGRNPSTPPQSIPLRDLTRPPDSIENGQDEQRLTRGRSLLGGRTGSIATRYERLNDSSPSPTDHDSRANRDVPPSRIPTSSAEEDTVGSPIDVVSFQAAMGFSGLTMPSARPEPDRLRSVSLDRSSPSNEASPYAPRASEPSEDQSYYTPAYTDSIPLTDPHYLQPLGGSQEPSTPTRRLSFQSIQFHTPDSKTRGSHLGDDLGLEAGYSRSRSHSFGATLEPGGPSRPRSRSPSAAGAIGFAGSLVRAMSQRVVNLSNEPEPIETNLHRNPSTSAEPAGRGRSFSIHSFNEEEAFTRGAIPTPLEKPPSGPTRQNSAAAPNPLRGKTLGIFSPDNAIRLRLCDLLVNPWTEPTILFLIIIQTILLAVEAGPSVYDHPRPRDYFSSWFGIAYIVIFIIYTLETCARIIVSGFISNAAEYSTIDRSRGIRAAIMDKYRLYFTPHLQRQASIRQPTASRDHGYGPSLVRTFTTFDGPLTVADQQRNQLARRAFLRHSFNRLDFVAVVSFWIAFVLAQTGIAAQKQLWVFQMMSCLRILRLLAITSGTSVILRSMKKAAPLLVNVSFLIGFFWLLFAIVGVQSFKSSLRRQCLWIDPEGVMENYNNDFTFCGGHLNNVTGVPEPWIKSDFSNGTDSPKGYLCPQQSVCMQQNNPYNGTVSFDNILQSLELVFVIMSGNTYSDLLYYTTNSDYLVAALFFAFGIVIMMFWLANLLIAVITSSFQIIRDENQGSSAFAGAEAAAVPEDDIKTRAKPSTLKMLYDKSYWLWIGVIVFDLLTQSSRSTNMSARVENFINNTEVVVTILLAAEIVLRFASDWRGFRRHTANWVDLGLAAITMVILLPPIRNSGQPYAWLTFFQIVRIYRVVLALPMTRQLILLVLGNVSGIANLVLFVFLITFLTAIFAVQLFRGDIPAADDSGDSIEVPFFTIWNAFLGMYQVLSSENWTTLLYTVTTHDDYLNTGWIGAIFLMGWFTLANFILLNMFIAAIQENFDVSEDEKRMHQVKAFLQRKEIGTSSSNLALSTIFSFGRARKKKDPLDYGPATMEMLLKDAVVRDFLDDDEEGERSPDTPGPENGLDHTANVKPGLLSSIWGRFVARVWNREPNPFYSNVNFTSPADGADARTMAKEAVSASSQRKRAQREYLARHPDYNVALFIFKPSHPLRKLCQRIVGPGRGHERFDGVEPHKAVWYTFSALIYACIVAMVLLACVTTPLYQKEYFNSHNFSVENWFVWTDMAFAVVFTIEALIKIIADGLFWTPNAYLRSLWGFVDGLVLITLWINVATSLSNDGAISRAVGAFKALRALRLLNVSDSARDTFHSVIIVGGWKVLSAAFVSMSLLIPFAIFGVNLFSGKLAQCNDSGDFTELQDCFGEYNSSPYSGDWPVLAPRVVSNPYYSFDNFGSSLFILFQIVSQEGWVDVMWSAESITGVGLQPQDFASQGNGIFFVIFNLMSTVFILTLFISVFMRNYTEQTGVAFLTTEQRSWLELRKLLRQVSPSKRPSNKASTEWRAWCYKLAVKKHGKWQRAVTVCLVVHLILLVLEFYPEPEVWERTRDYLFLAMTLFYITNIVVRIIGLTWARFRRSAWDVFSLLAVTGTFITTALLLSNFQSDMYVQLHKLFLVSIALLLIPRNNALDQLFKTAAASLTNIMNLLATWFVLFLVYAIALTQAFGLTRFGDNEDGNVNFRDVPKALILLFRMSTGEGWNQVMEDFAMIEPPRCVAGSNFFDSDCGSAAWARTLFISWNIVSMYIFVSLFVSLIYESFSYVYQRSSGLEIVSREEIRRFKQAWAAFDPRGSGYISKEHFPRLLGELSGVFAMRIYEEQDSVRRILEDCQTEPANMRSASIADSLAPASRPKDVNLQLLNERLAQIDFRKVRERRMRYNIFYEEVMVSADPDRGISFTSVLMILAHYNVISDSKSLRLEEFLRRRARLQRVEEEVRRRIVVGFFDTMYWARQFRRWRTRHDGARVTEVPTFAVPEIFVDEGESASLKKQPKVTTKSVLSSLEIPQENPGHGGSSSRRNTGGSLSPTQLSASGRRASEDGLAPGDTGSGRSSRRTSNVSADNVMDVLTDSVWGESIRRSFSVRRKSSEHRR